MRRKAPPSPDPRIAPVAALIADPARAAMLCALIDAGELAAGELALRAGVAPNAASAHLAKLVSGGLLHARADGRRRFFRLSGAYVAQALEALSVVAAPTPIVALSQARASADLREARSCYDHLAGKFGVALTRALVSCGAIVPVRNGTYRIAPAGRAYFASLGIDLNAVRDARRQFARQCTDWSERVPHLAGALGAAVLDAALRLRWVERAPAGRALRVTAAGRAALDRLALREISA